MSDILAEAAENARVGGLVAAQNDRFRTTFGADHSIPGRIIVTSGVGALSMAAQVAATFAVQRFADFTEDNDPFGLHDFGTFTVTDRGRDVKLYWKIDLYDAAYEFGSDTPEDPAKTRRILTILLPSEW